MWSVERPFTIINLYVKKSKQKWIKLVGVTFDVLKHTSIFFFQGAMNIRFYRSKLLSLYNNSSFQAWIMLKVVFLGICVSYCYLWLLSFFYPMHVFLLRVYTCGRSVFRKHLGQRTWHRTHTKPRFQPEAWVGGQRCTAIPRALVKTAEE